jgi:long-chain acyl-CoA synthetase
MSDSYQQRPWLSLYSAEMATIDQAFPDALAIFRSALARGPMQSAVLYSDQALTYRQLDELSDALAVWFSRQGIGQGDRIATILQNVPQFLIVLIAAWKLAAIPVPLNPMNRERELAVLFGDCSPKAIICHAENAISSSRALSCNSTTAKTHILLTSPILFHGHDDIPVPPCASVLGSPAPRNLTDAIQAHAGEKPVPVSVKGADSAALIYTSGTTGVPKGAMLSHGNVAFSAQVFRDWIGFEGQGSILGVAPLFHVTGLIGHAVLALLAAKPLVLGYRFQAATMLKVIRESRPCFTVGSITAFLALMNLPDTIPSDFSSFKAVYSGGAAVPVSIVQEWETKFGCYIHNAYGLTESTSPAILVPFGRRAPVDQQHGALSIGVPVFNTEAKIVGEDGRPVPVGVSGEILLKGPQVMLGYWGKLQETAESLRNGWLWTGDIGYMDAQGWFYLIDRKKDMINASGYKVWPREVEDVLYSHPSVREAAVVGVQDPYRGETVKAVVSLKAGHSVTPDQLARFCKELLASYKYPRIINIVDELPKTASGKILRRDLR